MPPPMPYPPLDPYDEPPIIPPLLYPPLDPYDELDPIIPAPPPAIIPPLFMVVWPPLFVTVVPVRDERGVDGSGEGGGRESSVCVSTLSLESCTQMSVRVSSPSFLFFSLFLSVSVSLSAALSASLSIARALFLSLSALYSSSPLSLLSFSTTYPLI